MKNWLSLIAGIILLYFSNGRFNTPFAPWIFCFFLLLFSRNLNSKFTAIILPVSFAVILQVAFWKFTSSNTKNILFYIPFMAGLLYGSLFYLDRINYLKNKSFIATLLLPLLYTVIDFLIGSFNPFGTTGMLAYSQSNFLIFAQLSSITGIWGLTFVMIWFGSLAYWAFDVKLEKAQRGLIAFTGILLLIFAYGAFRMQSTSNKNPIKITGIHTTDKEKDAKAFWKALAQKDTVKFNEASTLQTKNLINYTIEEAQKGAKYILWSEVSPTILFSQKEKLFNQLSHLSSELGIYLIANPYIASITGQKPENMVWVFNPKGELIYRHYKYGGNFIEGSVEGDKKIKYFETPDGKISSIICWDADFPNVVKQIGQQKIGLVFNPASDWNEITPLHTQVAIFRAIENGCSWVRQTRNGLSVMVDGTGKIHSEMNHFENSKWIMSGTINVHTIFSFYPFAGDWFGWLCLMMLLIFYGSKTLKNDKFTITQFFKKSV